MQIGSVWYVNIQPHAWNDTNKQSRVSGFIYRYKRNGDAWEQPQMRAFTHTNTSASLHIVHQSTPLSSAGDEYWQEQDAKRKQPVFLLLRHVLCVHTAITFMRHDYTANYRDPFQLWRYLSFGNKRNIKKAAKFILNLNCKKIVHLMPQKDLKKVPAARTHRCVYVCCACMCACLYTPESQSSED